jgi:hypothetical protein
MSGTISSVTSKPDLRAANRPSNQKSSYPFRAARRCTSVIREGNVVRAPGFHKPSSNPWYFRAVRR